MEEFDVDDLTFLVPGLPAGGLLLAHIMKILTGAKLCDAKLIEYNRYRPRM